MRTVYPIVMCGGIGSRLWPLSRPEKPKQFLSLLTEDSLLAATLERLPSGIHDDFSFAAPVLAGNVSHRKQLETELKRPGTEIEAVLLEPVKRNTAPSIAAAASFIAQHDTDALVLVVPSDAHIKNRIGFRDSALMAVRQAANSPLLMTIGVPPTRPETQYGYIERGTHLASGHKVRQFHEKPDLETARNYLCSGRFLWNTGMIVCGIQDLIKEFATHQPDLWRNTDAAISNAWHEGHWVHLDKRAFSACPNISMDHAILEKSKNIGVVEARFDWDDLGSWRQIHVHADKDANGNAIHGHGLTFEAQDTFIHAKDTLVAVAGTQGLTIVAEDGKVLVMSSDKSHLATNLKAALTTMTSQNPKLLSGDPDAIRGWLFDSALPLWAEKGLDHDHGGVHEALALDGSPAPHATKRLRVMARQIYCFAHGHIMGWQGDAAGVIGHCFKTLVETGWHDDGGWIHRYNPDGTVHDDTRDAYDQCFCLLGFAWMIRAGIDADAARAQIDRTLAFMDTQLADADNGGFREGIGKTVSQYRRANPHMHFLEAVLALYEATGETAYLDRATRMIALFERHFYDVETATLTEFFNNDWSRIDGAGKHERVEPGHHYEWAWLLLRYLGHRPHEGLEAKARTLFASARAFGHHSQTGAAADSMMPDGTDVSLTARCWPQTEALKAAVAFEKIGLQAATDLKAEMLRVLFTHYLDGPIKGGWYDSIDETGKVIAPDMPTSTFYHIYCALAEYLGE